MTFLSLLLAISFSYWVILWIKDYRFVRYITEKGPITLINIRRKEWSNILNGVIALVILVIFVAIASHPNINVTCGRILVFGGGLAVGFMGSSLPMASKSLKGTNLPYSHSFLHILIFLTYCIIATWILIGNFPWVESTSAILFEYRNPHSLIFLWSIFILINGLIMPFAISSYAYKRIGEKAMTHLEQKKSDLDKELRNIDLKLKFLKDWD